MSGKLDCLIVLNDAIVHHRMMQTLIAKPGPIDFVMMGITAIIWASAFIAIKVVVPETGPWWLATFRVGIGFIVLAPYALWRGFIMPENGTVWALIFVTALFNVVLPFVLISWAEIYIDAGVTALLMGTGPFLALLGSHFFSSDDRITPQKAIACMFGFTGVILIVGGDALRGLGGETALAQFAVLGGAVCYAIAGILIRKIDIPPIRLGFLAFGAGLVQLTILSLFFSGPPSLVMSQTALLSLIYLGIFPTALGQIFRFTLVKKVGYTVFALALNLIPVIGVTLGALLLGEVISSNTFIALALVLAGLFISQMEGRKKPA